VPEKSVEQRKAEKSAYDEEYRQKNRDRLKAEKALISKGPMTARRPVSSEKRPCLGMSNTAVSLNIAKRNPSMTGSIAPVNMASLPRRTS
jgi:hypothetical protein